MPDPSRPSRAGYRAFAGKTVAFDVETVPRLGLDELPRRERERIERLAGDEVRRHARGGIDEEPARIEAAVRKTLALHPLTCRIAPIAFHAVGGAAELVLVAASGVPAVRLQPPARAVSERELLQGFWTVAGRARALVGYHSAGFDLPVLLTRSALLEVPATVDLLTPAPAPRHIDLLERMSAVAPRAPRASLELTAFAFGIEAKTEGHGDGVGDLVAAGLLDQLARYNLEDARVTAALYRRLLGTWIAPRRSTLRR